MHYNAVAVFKESTKLKNIFRICTHKELIASIQCCF